jgi:hypothetical protein
MPLQLRRGTQNELNAITPLEGELIYVRPTPPLTTPKLFVGDGSTEGGILVTGLNENDAKAAAGQALESGAHVGIRFAYDSGNRIINATVDLSEATFNTINGSVVANDSTILVNAENGVISATSLNVGDATITADGETIDLPANSTIGGDPIGFTIGTDDSTNKVVANSSTVSIIGDNVNISTSINQEGHVVVAAAISTLKPAGQTNQSNTHYLPFVSEVETESAILCDGNLRYTPSTETLEVPTIISTTAINCPNVNSTVITTGEIIANNVLEITAGLTTGQTRHLVQVGSNAIDGRLRVVQNNYTNLAGVIYDQYHENADANDFRFNRGRGTSLAPTIVSSGDDISDITFAAFDGVQMTRAAAISVRTSGVISDGVVPGEIAIFTYNSLGVISQAVLIDSNQRTTFSGAITPATYTNDAARDLAIPTPTAGMMVYISGTGKFQGYNGATSTWNDFN